MTRPLAKKASVILDKYLDGKESGNERTKIAVTVLQTHVKMMATEANDDGNKLGLAKMIYADPKLREIYIKKSMPHMLEQEKK